MPSVELPTNITSRSITYCLKTLPDSKYNAIISLIRCIASMLDISPQPSPLIHEICAPLQTIIDDRDENSKWIKSYACAIIDLLLCDGLMSKNVMEWHGDRGCVKLLLEHSLEAASSRFGYIAVHMSMRLFEMHTRNSLIEQYQPFFLQYSWLFVKLLVYGPIRDLPEEVIAERLSLETFNMDMSLFQEDYMARVYMITVLNRLTETDKPFLYNITDKLMDILLVTDKEAERQGKRAFPNTLIHRTRIRAYQALLVLSPVLDKDKFQDIIQKILRCISLEHLPSTRLFAEWFLIIGFSKFPSFIPQYLKPQIQTITLGAGPLISSICILMHVALIIDQDDFYLEALGLLFPWFLHNSPAARMYTFYAFHRLAEKCDTSLLPENYRTIFNMIKGNDHCKRFIEKLTKDPMVSQFDPKALLSLEGIFLITPRLTQTIAANELIPVQAFEAVSKVGHIPFRSDFVYDLSQPNVDISDSPKQLSSIYQQKINTLDLSLNDLSLDSTFIKTPNSEVKQDSSIIVVASLLDRIPNMAALCRSAEIFGVDHLVLPDISVIQSKDFQTVCMTSDQWIPMSQVTPLDLPSHLTNLRKAHYTIIALEQSSNSLPLHTYTFPPKFCLLLGNEREGIAADLLDLCDVCLEIPQFGVVRSLNVHVAGSLVLWQARQQQLLQSRPEK